MNGWMDGWGLYCYLNVCRINGCRNPRMNAGKPIDPSIISHFGSQSKGGEEGKSGRFRSANGQHIWLFSTILRGSFTSRLPSRSSQAHQEVAELSMQRITAVTSCDHRRNEKREGGTEREWQVVWRRGRERERGGRREGGRRRCSWE